MPPPEHRDAAEERRRADALQAPGPGDPPWPARPSGWRHDFPAPPWAFPVPFTPLDGLGLLGWTIVAQVVVVGVVVGLTGDDDLGDVASLITVLAIYLVTLVGVAVVLRARGALSWRVLGPLPPTLRQAGIGVGAGVVGWLGINALLALVSFLTAYEPATRQSVLEQAESGTAQVLLGVLVAGVVGPLTEEVIHRGVLFQSLRRRAGLWPAVGLSSLAFAAAHLELAGEPPLLLALAVFGALLAVVFHRAGSLLAAVVAHGTFNSLTLAVSFLAAGGA